MVQRPNRQDALIASAFLVWAMVEIAVGAVSGPVAISVVAAAFATGALAWRRSAPVTCALVCAGGLTLKTALGLQLDGLAMLAALLVASYSVGRHVAPARAALTALAMVVLAWLSLFGLPEADQTVSNYPFIMLWVGAPAAAGAALRSQVRKASLFADRAARAEVSGQEQARVAVQSERVRLAREVHDTVAHAVSVMVLHSGAVRSRLPDDFDSEKRALGQAEDAGRQAISELHRLLRVLRSEDAQPDTEPQPTLAQLDQLLADTRRSGLVVEMRIDGDRRALPSAVEVSAYRILQEALTNVRKHACAHAVCIRLGYDDDWLRLCVTDDGVGAGASSEGYGLIGMRERVAGYGGRLIVSSPRAGGFALEASLPVHGS